MTYDLSKTCCFTGHRIIPQKDRSFLEQGTEKVCISLIERGYENFIAGGALGFDTLAEKCVLKLKEKYPNIKLILAIPCKDQHKNWTQKDKAVYEEILSLADDKIYVSESYSPECMKKRNRFMVDHSSAVVSYITKVTGGAVYTVTYGVEKGREIIFIRP